MHNLAGLFLVIRNWWGGYRQMFGGCKHAQIANLNLKTFKNRNNYIELGGVGCRLSTGRGEGILPPPRGV